MITGMENTLKASLISEIGASILSATGNPPASPNAISPLCEGIANATIPFLVSNMEVNPGIPVTTVGGPTTQSGATTAPGTVS